MKVKVRMPLISSIANQAMMYFMVDISMYSLLWGEGFWYLLFGRGFQIYAYVILPLFEN